MTIFGENEKDKFENKVTKYDLSGYYDDLFNLFKHLNKIKG